MPAIGKFHPALRSMVTTVADFFEQRPMQLGTDIAQLRGSMVMEKKGTRRTLLTAGRVFSAVAMTAAFAQSESNSGSAPTRRRYLPAEGETEKWLGAALLKELSVINIDEYCNRLNPNTEATNLSARHFYGLEGLAAVGS